MIVGLDFDNTIINYDPVFSKVALEQGLVPPLTPATKVAVRDYLRQQEREEVWTELQGYVYGKRLADAEPFEGVLVFLAGARERGVVVTIISHKTRYPYLGPRYDLHGAARVWIDTELRDEQGPLVAEERVLFHETKVEKITSIAAQQCEAYLDDLPEILEDSRFPRRARAILFDPQHEYARLATDAFTVIRHWHELDAELACL